MAYSQATTIQDAKTIRIGSVKLEIGPYGGGYTDVGALVDASFVHSWDDVTVKSDNAGIIEEGITNEIVTVSGVWQEINVANLGLAFAGIGTADTVAAAPESITDEAVVVNDYDLSEFTYKNGDGSEVDSIVVADAATAVITYVRDCDYVVVTKANGNTAIARAFATPIVTASGDITVATPALTYALGAGAYLDNLAIGDHIIVSGCAESGNNGVKTVTAFTDTLITVAEACTGEVETGTVTITRGGIATGATVYADYNYTPLASRTITFGGLTSKTARILRLTNTNVAGLTWIMLVHKAYINAGLNLQFPADDDRNPLPCPISFVGKIDVLRASGDQLFNIADTQDTD